MMMGGRTKIGIGRTTRVKAVSMIAWGKDENIVHMLHFKHCSELDLIFPFMRSDVCWVTAAEQEMMHFPIISCHHLKMQFTKKNKTTHSKCINTFSAVEYQVCWACKKRHSHVSQQFWRIPPHSRCCLEHRFPQRAHCVSSGPRYRCLHWLRTRREKQLL